MFTVDTKSNKDYYIILKDGKEFVKVSKTNSIDSIVKYFNIKLINKEVVPNEK